ncbi:MAG: hypothetical protein LBU67_03380 [Oscillospiraceae bacterium]|jgi:hypothetical protein|nr:hypothetical protein [Oscillospiraceae bacterium]
MPGNYLEDYLRALAAEAPAPSPDIPACKRAYNEQLAQLQGVAARRAQSASPTERADLARQLDAINSRMAALLAQIGPCTDEEAAAGFTL